MSFGTVFSRKKVWLEFVINKLVQKKFVTDRTVVCSVQYFSMEG